VSCGHSDESTETEAQRRVLRIALVLNVTMFIAGLVAGLLGQSSSLIADALDMLADASAYAIALGAIGRSTRFKAGAATLSGTNRSLRRRTSVAGSHMTQRWRERDSNSWSPPQMKNSQSDCSMARSFIDRHRWDSPPNTRVRTRLSAGASRIRTLGPTVISAALWSLTEPTVDGAVAAPG
jgi:Cation efflux family